MGKHIRQECVNVRDVVLFVHIIRTEQNRTEVLLDLSIYSSSSQNKKKKYLSDDERAGWLG